MNRPEPLLKNNGCDDPSIRRGTCLWILVALWLFHVVNNILFLLQTDTPPSYDCGYHLQLSFNFFENLFDFGNEEYFSRLLYSSSSYYPLFGYAATAPFYLAFGVSEDSAVLANLFFLALLLWSTYEIGRRLSSPGVGVFSALLTSFFPFVYGISRVYYLESALMAMVAWSVLRLLKTEGFSKPGASALFGLSVGLGMMTKWTFALFLIGPVLAEAGRGILSAFHESESGERVVFDKIGSRWTYFLVFACVVLLALALRSSRAAIWVPASLLPMLLLFGFYLTRKLQLRCWNLVASGAVAVLVCYPWYYEFLDHISAIAGAHIQKSSLSLANLLYYPLALQNNQLGPGFFLLLLATPFLLTRAAYRTYTPIVVWAIGGYAFFTLVPFSFNDPRFIAPYLPALGLLMGKTLLSPRRLIIRNALICLSIVIGIWQFGMNTYNWPLPASNNMKLTKYGYITFWYHGIYGSGAERGRQWPNEEIVETFESGLSESRAEGSRPRLRFLVDRPFFHQAAFQFHARIRGNRWEAVFGRDPLPLEMELERSLDSEAVLLSNSLQIDDQYFGLGDRKPFEWNQGERSFFRVRFPEQLVYDLPDGTSVTLAWRSEDATLRNGMETNTLFGPHIGLASATFAPVSASPSQFILRCQWEISGTVTDRDWRAVCGLWRLDGRLMEDWDLSLTAGREVSEYRLTLTDFEPSANESIGLYQLALGLRKGEESADPVPIEIPGIGEREWIFFRKPIGVR